MAVLKDLIVHGASRFLGDSYFNEIVTDEISLRKIKAKQDNTISIVAGLVDVDGELHTKSFTNSNIATIDGSFYITPTITLQGGETSGYSVVATTNSLSFSGTSYDLGSAYLDGSDSAIDWSRNSKVIVTGEVLLNNEWIPLGTLKGTLSTYSKDTSPNSIVIDGILDSINQPSKVLPLIAGMGNLHYRKVKISLISVYRSSRLNPLGIYMTAVGPSGKTFLDIYGGNLVETSSYGGLSTPVLRIGNLKGLPKVNDVGDPILPNGWGIYTSNGFFSGTIVAKQGQIGSYKIDSQYLQSSDGTTGLSIRDDSNTLDWAFWAGGTSTSTASFRVTHDGTLYCKNIQATGGNISGNVSIGGNVTIASTVTIGGKNQSEYLNSNIDIGGTNLLVDSGDLSKWNKESGVSVEWDSTEGMYKIIDSTHTNSRWGIYKDFVVEPNTTYTCSMTGKEVSHNVDLGVASTSASTYSGFPNGNISYSTTKNRLSYTFTTGSDHTLARIYICIFPTATGSYGYALKPKIEKGNKATDWSPAPEDVQTEIDSKKSVHTLNSNYSSAVLRATYAQILGWSAEGKPDSWNVTSTSGIKVGDTVRIALKVSDFSDAIVYLVTTVTAVNSAINISTISHGLDSTVIDGGRILANSVGANQIKANEITVGSLGDGENYALRKYIEPSEFLDESTTYETHTVNGDSITLNRINVAGTTGHMGVYVDVPCKPGRYYSLSLDFTAVTTDPSNTNVFLGGDYGESSIWTDLGKKNYTGVKIGKVSCSSNRPTSSTQTFVRVYVAIKSVEESVTFKNICLTEGDEMTVIDGSHIVTGTVSANAISATSGTFNTANIPDLNASKITAGTISVSNLPDDALNSNIQVGGRNLLARSLFVPVNLGPDIIDGNGYITDSSPTSDGRGWGYSYCEWKTSLGAGTYTLSWETAVTTSESNSIMYVYDSSSTSLGSYNRPFQTIGTKSLIFTLSANTNIGIEAKVYGAKVRFKLEKGNKATDWTPAPEDVQSEIDAKKSIHTISCIGGDASATYANILKWSGENQYYAWNVESTSGVCVGDTVRLKTNVSDMGDVTVYILGTVSSIDSATQLHMYSHGLDTTAIHGGMLIANTVGANQIKANSISAEKLVIGDFNNYITSSENNVTSLADGSISDGWIMKQAEKNNLWLSPVVPQWTRAGEKYRLTGTIKTPANGTARVYIYGRDASGTAISSVYSPVFTMVANTELSINEVITIDANVASQPQANIAIYFWDTSNNWQAGYCKQMKLERMSGGELIIDGSLTIGAMSAEATKSIINNENLFGYGSQLESLNGVRQSGFEIVTEDGYKCAHASGALQTTKYIISDIKFIPKPKETVTISGYIKLKSIVYGTTNPMCEFYIDGQTINGGWRSATIDAVYIDGVSVTPNGSRFPTYISDTNWHHIALVRTWENYTFTNPLLPAVYLRDCTGDLYVRNIKYERGNTYTDWTPASRDLETQWEIPSSLIANENSTHCTMSLSGNNITITRITTGSSYGCYYDMPCKPNTFYSASIRVISGSDFNITFGGDYGSGSAWSGLGVSHRRTSNGKQYAASSRATSATQSYLRIYIFSSVQNATMTFTDLTVYEGDDIGLLDRGAYNASLVATNYITNIDSNNGITIKAVNGTTTANASTSNYLRLNSNNGLEFYKAGVLAASYGGSTAQIGYVSGKNIILDSDGVKIRNGSTTLALYGANTTFYKTDGVTPAAVIGANGIDIKTGGIIGNWSITNGWLYYKSSTSTTDYSDATLSANTLELREIKNSTLYTYATISKNGQMSLDNEGGASYVRVNSVYACSLHSSTAGNRGIYDDASSVWMIQKDTSNNVTINADGNQVSLVNTTGKNVHFYYNTSNSINYLRPSTTGMRLADSTYPWDYIFSAHALQTSDLKKKSIIKDFNWRVDEFIRGLKPIAYNRIKDNGEISRRIDLGFGAQDVSKLSKELNIGDLALYNANIIDFDEQGNPIEKNYHGEKIDDSKLSWSLDYSEFIAPMVLEIQRLMDRVDKLESEIKRLKS